MKKMLSIRELVALLTIAGALATSSIPHDHDAHSHSRAHAAAHVEPDVKTSCKFDKIELSIRMNGTSFSGLVYPKGLSRNSSCMMEYVQHGEKIEYSVPLHSCNTLSADMDDGIEYYNTIVVQNHKKLLTSQGSELHIRCRYATVEKTLQSDLDVNSLRATSFVASAAVPNSRMRIYLGDPIDDNAAEEVKVGDLLALVVSLDGQNIYGMHISMCFVKDGLGWSEQLLIGPDGCSLDTGVMGQFRYSDSKTTGVAYFEAHKFPHTATVHYQCNVRLCVKHSGGCDSVPPLCGDAIKATNRRRDRRSDSGATADVSEELLRVSASLRVNELNNDEAVSKLESRSLASVCFDKRLVAVVLSLLGVIVVTAIVFAILRLQSKK